MTGTRRFFVCPVVGSGSMNDPYRAAIANAGITHHEVADFPTDENGRPTVAEVIVSVPDSDGDVAATVTGVEEITADDPRLPAVWQ